MTTLSSSYGLYYTSPSGGNTTLLGDFSKLEYARRIGQVGTLSVVLAGDYPVDMFQEDGILKVYRSSSPGIPGRLDMSTFWLVQSIEMGKDEAGREYCVLGAVDALAILARRGVAYYGGTAYVSKTDTADNIMKALIRENYGSLAFDTARDLSAYISVASDLSVGPATTIEGIEWRKSILDILNELKDQSIQLGVPIYFDLVPDGNNAQSLTFVTYSNYVGVDRTSSNGVTFSETNGALKNPKLVKDYTDEVNYVYSRGRGDGTDAIVEEVSDATRVGASVFNRREAFVNDSNSTSTAELTRVGNAELRYGRPRIIFDATIQQTADLTYGIQYGYGDAVRAVYKNYVLPCVIDNMRVQVGSDSDGSWEQLDIRMHGEFYNG